MQEYNGEIQAQDLTTYRLHNNELKILSLEEHTNQVAASIISLTENIKTINGNLKECIESTLKLTHQIHEIQEQINKRLVTIETDMQAKNMIRQARQNWVSRINAFLPITLIILCALTAVDHDKFIALINGANSVR